jgi:PAS domain S-box-containing protein
MKILFVEDSVADLELAVRQLRDSKIAFEHKRVDTKKLFLRAIELFQPDVVITDYTMPHFDGMQALLLSLEENPHRPVIILTTSLNESIAVACMKAGASDYVLKEQLSRLPFAVSEALTKKTLLKEKDKALADLKKSEEKFRTLAEMAPVGIFLTDNNGKYLYTNTLCKTMIGATNPESSNDTWLTRLHPSDREMVVSSWQQMVQEKSLWLKEFRFEHSGGETIWVYGLASPLVDSLHHTAGFVGVFADISEQKRMEEELYLAKTRAEESSLATRRFFSMMSHELRTPLNPILGFIELLSISPNLTSEQRQWLNIAFERGVDLNNLINRVLDLARLEANEMPLDPQPIRLRNVVADMVTLFKPTIEKKGLRIRSSVSAEIPDRIVVDPQRLRQILTNLIDNAIKFTKMGEISLETVSAHASETLQPPPKTFTGIRFCVRDSGIGIAPEKLTTIFRPFEQAEVSHVVEFGGTGLGLSIVANLAKLMGGKVWVESKLGIGTAFYFTIVAKTDVNEFVKQEKTCEKVSHDHQPLRVLVVDDDASSRWLAAEILRQRGDVVFMATDGKEAIERMEAEAIDVILMDLRMPNLDGFRATQRIREIDSQWSRHTKIIALTAYAYSEDKKQCLESGMDGYLSKPIVAKDLYAAIDSVQNNVLNSFTQM